MARFRWFGLAVSAAAVVAAVSFGASSIAATHATSTSTDKNYKGPPRPPAVKIAVHGTNYRGPAQKPTRVKIGRDSNVPASIQAQRGADK